MRALAKFLHFSYLFGVFSVGASANYFKEIIFVFYKTIFLSNRKFFLGLDELANNC